MKWSRYNHVLRSQEHDGTFIYNASSNSFLKITEGLLSQMEAIDDWKEGLSSFDPDFQQILQSHKIVVEEAYDDHFRNIAQYRSYLSCFVDDLLGLTIATTTNCNFKCPYCYEAGVAPVTMNRETEEAILAFIGNREKLRITWYGGEPLMNFGSIVRLTERLSQTDTLKKVTYSLITNGYYLDEEKCRFFANHQLKRIQITIDGPEEVHNASRIAKNGQPTFSTILSNIDRGLELMPDTHFSIRVNIGTETREAYPILYRQLRERWKAYQNFSIYMEFIEDYNVCGGSFFKSKEKMLYLKSLAQTHGIYQDRIYPTFGTNQCVANTQNGYVISANGDLYKCWSDIGKEHKKVGTVFAPDKRSNSALLAEYAVRLNKFEDPKCLHCFLLPVCKGGCPAHRYENKHEGTHHEICPYMLDNIDIALEWYYELTMRSKEYQTNSQAL